MSDRPTLFVSFSGGRTSALMMVKLLEADEYNLIPLFANTGCEHHETYEFIHKFETHFNVDIHWLEAVVNPERGKGIRAKRVDYASADRDGGPFDNYVAKYGIPNTTRPQCTSRLKTDVMENYRKDLGYHRMHLTAVGIRADERRRIKPAHYDKMNLCFPLADTWPTTKEEVLTYWKKMPFDLNLPEHKGNCVTCWKKSDRKLFTLALEDPEQFRHFDQMERRYGHKFSRDGEPLTFFRKRRSARDIIAEAHTTDFVPAEELGPIQLDLLSPEDRVAALLSDTSELDFEGECGESGCDIVASLEEKFGVGT